jgi:23S rRNA (pseudouridine1915-N3)-methyltransferase
LARIGGEITVAVVGRLKEPHWRAAQEEYLARLARYADVKLVEVKDAVGQGLPDDAAVVREGRDLLDATAEARHRSALTSSGKLLTSRELAFWLKKQIEVYGRIAFVIGGPMGFSKEISAACRTRISLSPLTFPHELARVMLLEQLYRAATILNGEKYHK